jgi:hypothetical protein
MSRTRRAVLALLLAFGACFSSRTQRLGAIEPWPLTAGERGAVVTLRVYGNQRYESGPAELTLDELGLCRDQALRAYRESGLFSSVQDGWDGEGLIAEVGFLMRTQAVKSQQWLATTLNVRRRELSMRTRFRDASGRALGQIEVSEVVRVDGYPLFLPLGDSPSSSIMRQVIYDLHRATLRDALAKGILPASGQ